jgi:hypothetical protein
MGTGIAEADEDELGDHLVVIEVAVEPSDKGKVPVAIAEVEHGVTLRGFARVGRGKGHVEQVIAAIGGTREGTNLGVGNRVGR